MISLNLATKPYLNICTPLDIAAKAQPCCAAPMQCRETMSAARVVLFSQVALSLQ
jgi:hypothetical protein